MFVSSVNKRLFLRNSRFQTLIQKAKIRKKEHLDCQRLQKKWHGLHGFLYNAINERISSQHYYFTKSIL